MADKMSVKNDNFDYTIPVSGVGEKVLLLKTTNQFVDKDIVIRTSTTAVGAASLAITDKASTNITVGTVSGGYYPLTTSLDGTVTFASAGWVGTTVGPLTDSAVTVGRIAQSTLKNGTSNINSGATITPNPTASQTINISAGYNGARTVVVAPMSSGTKAVGTTNATATAKTPTLVHQASAIGSKVQVEPDADVGIQTNSGNMTAAKYYLALKAATAAIPNADFTKSATATTAGYLGGVGATTQITPSASVTGAEQLFYVPLTAGSITISGTKTATAPTIANKGDASVSGKTLVTAAPTTATSGISKFYIALTATAPSTTITESNMSKSITAGYMSADEINIGNFTVNQSTNTYYIPLTSAVLKANAGTATAEKGNLAAITNVSSAPTDGSYYFVVKGSGKTGVSTAGWIGTGDNLITSNTATTYYTIPKATFEASGNIVKSKTAGYIAADQEVLSISAGSISTSATDPGTGYTANTSAIVPSGGYLVLSAGYYNATKISLATLVPDGTDDKPATASSMLAGYMAYDKDGALLTGTISTYDGTYTLT